MLNHTDFLGEVTLFHRKKSPASVLPETFPAFPQQPLRRQGEADVGLRAVGAWEELLELGPWGKTWEVH